MTTHFERLTEIYTSGCIPWDNPLPPPEVLALAATLPAGHALDLGCGFGRASLHLARLGWQVDGVDFIPAAIDEARRRAEHAGLSARARFHLASVVTLPGFTGPYDLALDVGCAHAFAPDDWRTYHQRLVAVVRPGGRYLLFAHLNDAETPADQRRWAEDDFIRALFATGFTLDKAEYGQTQVRDQAPWRSAWYWFTRVIS